jgi:diguanylate cyclase (GGDEF)-like protein
MAKPGSSYHRALFSRLLWPTGILFVSILWLVFATILWTSDSVNRVAAERQHELLAGAIRHRLETFRDDVARTADVSGLELVGHAPGKVNVPSFDLLLRRLPMVDVGLLATRQFKLAAGLEGQKRIGQARLDELKPLLEGAVEEATRVLLRGDQDRPREMASRLLADGTQLYFALASALSDGGVIDQQGGYVLAFLKRVDETEFKSIAAAHGVENLRVAQEPPRGGGFLPIQDGSGAPAAYLTWSPDRPGDLMRQRLVPLMMVGFCVAAVLFVALAFYLHWVTKDLARSQARSQELVGRDPLSGLANRLFFSERLDHELSRMAVTGDGLAVLFIDLDRFKDVNDTYGHQAGDALIQLVAARLVDVLERPDTLARFGGDEFAIIQAGIRGAHAAEALSRRILDKLTHPFEIAHTQVTVGASIGVALAPENALDRESLMRLADTALYQAKSEGRNRYCLFQSRMDETIRMRKMVEDDLRDAISNDGLVLHYQPVFSSDGERIVGLEALVRWPHATKGLISPGQFIGLAEERGLIIPLGEWVLRRACEDGKRWPGLRIAVNVSAIQFRHRSFVESVTRVLAETGFDASRLELELTEGVVVDDADAAEAAIMDLRALGIHLALDDFGTGYSSLIYLRRFAFDTIKIDRSFLESMEATGESAILVHSIVHLGRALGLTVTAEGVETREQHRFLQALGCHQLQGFLFSPPVSAKEIDRLLALGSARTAAPANAA